MHACLSALLVSCSWLCVCLTLSLSVNGVQSDAGFHPNKSKVSSSTMETWKNSNITGDLTQVPGIGKAAAAKLANAEVANVREL